MGGPWEDYSPTVPAPGLALPGSVQPYAQPAVGDKSSYRGVPDDEAMLADIFYNKGKGLGTIINQSPLHEGAKVYQKSVDEARAKVANTQDALPSILGEIGAMERRYKESGPDVAKMAIGPSYADAKSGEKSGFSNFMGTVGNLVAGAKSYNDPNSRAIALGLDSGSPEFKAQQAAMHPEDPNYGKAANLNTELHHWKKGISMLFDSIPGSGKGGSTDAAKARVEEALDAAIHARDPETFFRVVHTAKNALRDLGRLPPLPEPQSFMPPEWGQPAAPGQQLQQPPQQAAMAPPQQDPSQGAGRFAAPGLAAAQPMPADAVAMLRSDTSKARRDQFDEIFGKGAAERALRGR